MTHERRQCPVCGRWPLAGNTTKHHMRPKSRGGRDTERLCLSCHRQAHVLFTNKELEDLDTVDKLRSQPRMQKYIRWVSGRNPDRYFRGRTRRR